MRKLGVVLLMAIAVASCKDKAEKESGDVSTEPATESLSQTNSEDEWTTLFDGTSLDDWEIYQGGDPGAYWKIEDGALVFNPPADRKKGQILDIVSKKEYTNFVLSLEWKISEAGNSGVFWGINDDEKFEKPYHTGMEIQVLDNEKHPDAKNGTTHQAGALYDLVEPSKDATKPVGEWNTCVITIDHNTNKGSSVLNGVEVATFPVGGDELEALLKGSKFEKWEGFAKFKTGKIGLQDHGNVVAFRNIKLKQL
ncbi:3-keto-disaccharide hydrolase [Kriegella aquimaris]|uniref:3-keto-alpha-glucoside-1,2-lyase/3-keto-2-hydroxy-glucal hydratase domain-containing protein n=1 Tax=Kriegella aquimaris TaxID=192904 RepID=A0A1G9QVS6_9FLAO|nr:DUF1080 domain-containing protein [Kriegella aquimaris]SDM14971.1 protein of unknown function [Kriegella aquimaris]